MAILARYTPKNIEVEVIDVLTTCDNRKRVVIRATAGEPFQKYTHGGWIETDCAVVSPDLLAEVHQVQDTNGSGGE